MYAIPQTFSWGRLWDGPHGNIICRDAEHMTSSQQLHITLKLKTKSISDLQSAFSLSRWWPGFKKNSLRWLTEFSWLTNAHQTKTGNQLKTVNHPSEFFFSAGMFHTFQLKHHMLLWTAVLTLYYYFLHI